MLRKPPRSERSNNKMHIKGPLRTCKINPEQSTLRHSLTKQLDFKVYRNRRRRERSPEGWDSTAPVTGPDQTACCLWPTGWQRSRCGAVPAGLAGNHLHGARESCSGAGSHWRYPTAKLSQARSGGSGRRLGCHRCCPAPLEPGAGKTMKQYFLTLEELQIVQPANQEEGGLFAVTSPLPLLTKLSNAPAGRERYLKGPCSFSQGRQRGVNLELRVTCTTIRELTLFSFCRLSSSPTFLLHYFYFITIYTICTYLFNFIHQTEQPFMLSGSPSVSGPWWLFSWAQWTRI